MALALFTSTGVPGRTMILCSMEASTTTKPRLPPSALAVASAIRTAANGEVEFSSRTGLSMIRPSLEMLTLCSDQMRVCELKHELRLTLYVRTMESYIEATSELQLRRVSSDLEELVLLFNSALKSSVEQAEMYLLEHTAMEVPELEALVLPLSRELCLVGLLVAERTSRSSEFEDFKSVVQNSLFTVDETNALLELSRSLALICAMDQRAELLQHAAWDRSAKISKLLEQAWRSLAVIRTLVKMLLPNFKKGEITRDMLEDILVQGSRTRDILQQVQELLHPGWQSSSAGSTVKWLSEDKEYVQPRLSSSAAAPEEAEKAPGYGEPRSCNVTELLRQLVTSGRATALHMNLQLELELEDTPLEAAVDDYLLKQALSKLIESAIFRTPPGGWIRLTARKTPSEVLIQLEDNGPNMMPAEFATLKLARDILESSGAVFETTSPFLVGHSEDSVPGRGGVRVQLWLPSETSS